ncbi:MAG: hypothetical protein AAGG44_06745 [Planctomycetota bacterium]
MQPILPCPACSTFLLLPNGVESTELTCPKCRHTISLSELATWEVGNSDLGLAAQETTGEDSSESLELAPAMTGSSNNDLSAGIDQSATQPSDELQLAASDAPAPAAKPAFSSVQPITHEQFERLKRKKRSPIWSIAQVILGGLAAIPIALLILWHVLGRDVAEAGPTVARYIPWIVPERFHPLDMESEQDEDGQSDESPQRERGDSGFRQFDELLPDEDEPSADTSSERTEGSQSSGTLSSLSRPSETSNSSKSAAGQTQPNNGNGNLAALSRPRSSDTNSAPTALKGSMQSSASEVSPNVILQIKSCEQHIEDWRVAVRNGDGDLRALAQEIYADLVDVAAATQALPEGSPRFRVIRDALQPVSQAIKRQSDVQKIIIQGAEHWSRNTYDLDEDKDSNGKALTIICEIEQVTESDTEWVIQPKRESLPESINEIRIPRAIAPSLLAGQQLFLLGTLTQASGDVVTLAEIQGEEPPQDSSEAAPNSGTFNACYLYAF